MRGPVLRPCGQLLHYGLKDSTARYLCEPLERRVLLNALTVSESNATALYTQYSQLAEGPQALPGNMQKRALDESVKHPAASILTVNGGLADDVIRIQINPNDGNYIQVYVHEVLEFDVDRATISSIIVNGFGGSDTVYVDSIQPGTPIAVNGDIGDDALHLSEPERFLDRIQSAVSFDGGLLGNDVVTLWDNAFIVGDAYTITGTAVTRPFFGGLSYSQAEELILYAENGSNSIVINSTQIKTTIHCGGGDDVVSAGAGNLDALQSPLSGFIWINGDAGSDTLTLDNSLNFADVGFSFDYDRVSYPQPSAISIVYYTMESLIVQAGPGNNDMLVQGSASGTPVTINAGDGNDEVFFLPLDASALESDISADAGAGTDKITLSESASGATAYTVTSTTCVSPYSQLITYNGFEAFDLFAGINAEVTVSSTAPGCAYKFGAGVGPDENFDYTVVLGTGNLDALFSPITVIDGIDAVVLNDSTAGFNDPYSISSTTVTRPFFGGLTYSGIESLTLNAETGNNTIDIGSTAPEVDYTINANSGDDTVNLGTGNLDVIAGAVYVSGEGGSDTVNVDDSAGAIVDTYTITSITVLGRDFFGGLTYGAIEYLNMAGQVDDNNYLISSLALGTRLSITDYGGNDIFNVGMGNLQNVAGALVINAGPGNNDAILIDDTAFITVANTRYDITANSVAANTGFGGVTISNYEALALYGHGSGGATGVRAYEILSTSPGSVVSVVGNIGGDRFFVGRIAGGPNNIQGALTIDGGSSHDFIDFYEDTLDFGNDTYTITSTSLSRPGFAGLSYARVEELIVTGQLGDNTYNINSTDGGFFLRLTDGEGTDTFNVNETSGAWASIYSPTGDDIVTVNIDGAGTATALFFAPHRIGPLTVGAGGLLQLFGNNATLTTPSVSISATGRLDVGVNDMIVDYTGASPLSTINGYLATGYAGGAWNGNGIQSSSAATNLNQDTALGIGESLDIIGPGGGMFAGQNVDDTALLIKYTYYGDASLDGGVDTVDFNRLAANFGNAGTHWAKGDFNFDQVTDTVDFNRLAANFSKTGLAQSLGIAATAEDWLDHPAFREDYLLN